MFETLLFFFKQKFILGDVFFKIPKNLIRGFFFAEADTKKQICLGKNLECCTGKLTD